MRISYKENSIQFRGERTVCLISGTGKTYYLFQENSWSKLLLHIDFREIKMCERQKKFKKSEKLFM